MTSDLSNEAAANRYFYKASLIGAAHQFELTDDGLSWKVGGKSGVWPYADIAAGAAIVPAGVDAIAPFPRRYHAQGQTAYRHLLDQLADRRLDDAAGSGTTPPSSRSCMPRMQRAGSKAALVGGLKSGLYIAGAVVVALVAISITGLLVRALATGEHAGALFLVGFAALFGWQIGGFMQAQPAADLYVRSSADGRCRNAASQSSAIKCDFASAAAASCRAFASRADCGGSTYRLPMRPKLPRSMQGI